MKYLLILFIAVSYHCNAQQEETTLFLPLDKVDTPPSFPGCGTGDIISCSKQKVADFLMRNIDPQLLFSLEEAENPVKIRFIVDTAGKIRRPIAITKDEKLRLAATELLTTLPDFTPGTHEGEPVNVIVDVPVKLSRGFPSEEIEANSQVTGDLTSEKSTSKTLPIAIACQGTTNPEECSTIWLQKFVQMNINTDKFLGKSNVFKVIVSFIINEEGKITSVTAEGDPEKLKKEAIRVVKKLPVFIPAKEDGKNVSYNYSLPVNMVITKFRN